ncbi:MAG: ATP-dependent helicase HrpB [Myxococcales bacterium]|nr:ATP-dependent helicase HrpB [Myxococcales bacterium]
MLPLPIDPTLPDILRSLAERPSLVLEAPPGAGKTTRVPRAMLDSGAFRGDIVVLEPRRLAARMAAERVAEELGEAVGGTVGYQVRFEDKTSPRTRVRFVTEGTLTRRLLSDPELRGTAAVVLDEFHERHVHGDVALALVRRLQRGPRPDLAIVVMSATLETDPVAAYLGCPIVRTEGRAHPVAIEHLPAPDDRKLELQVVSALRRLVNEGEGGDVLVFLPGAAEIRACLEAAAPLAAQASLELLPLHGELSPEEQRRAVRRADRRKVIFSTNVAESSVTIDGVVAVVDSGLHRQASFAPWSGLPRLAVAKISKASAVQRAGRAGRTRPGRALRLYTKADHDGRPDHDAPELQRVDLAQLRLELASLGAADLEWLDAPTPDAWRVAGDLLVRLGATDAAGALSDLGKRMLRFPAHPRAARVLCEAEDRGVSARAATVCALLGERDIRRGERVSMGGRGRGHDHATEASDLVMLEGLYDEAEASGFSASSLRAIGLDAAPVHAARRAADRLRSLARDRAAAPSAAESDERLQRAILAGFPDRVARRKAPGSRELALAGGGIATLAESSVVRTAEFVCAVHAEGRAETGARGVVVRLASAIEPEWLIDAFEDRVVDRTAATWNEQRGRVETSSQLVYDGLVLSESRAKAPHGEAAARLLFEKAKAKGARAFAPEGELDRLVARLHHARSQDEAIWAPSPSDVDALLLEACEGRASLAELEEAGLLELLRAKAGARARLDELAPERTRLASGREARVSYELGKPPWVESFLQDFCGMRETPRAGRVPLVVHMLAPNRRAVQITTDVPGFFERHYAQVRKELMRKYPRHAWPEDTSAAIPMRTRRS